MDGTVPHFTVRDLDGRTVAYADIWQRRNLVLVSIPPGDSAAQALAESLRQRAPELDGLAAVLVVTEDALQDLRPGAAVVADRWGEVYFAVEGQPAAELPSADELLDWLRYVQVQCPECQGETR
jgi:hypothetical protein